MKISAFTSIETTANYYIILFIAYKAVDKPLKRQNNSKNSNLQNEIT